MLRNPYDVYGAIGDYKPSLAYSSAEYVPASLVSSMVANGMEPGQISPRQYIDPWDLENLAYLERSRHSEQTDCETTTEDQYNSEEGCQSTASSQFYYRGASRDEQDIYMALTRHKDPRVRTYACDGSCSNSLCENIYEKRPQLQFPQPPSYDYYEFDPYESDAQTVMECQECSLSYDHKDYHYPTSDIYQPIYSTNTPPHFSLSKKGLLQIDYSLNWNCLDMDFRKMQL